MSELAAAVPSTLGHRPFALFWFARVLSSLAYHMQTVAVGWQVYALTDSALSLGFIGLAQFLPGVVLGTLAEYEPGKRLSKRTAGLRVLITYSLLLVIGFAAWFAWIPVEHAAKEPGASSLTLIGDEVERVLLLDEVVSRSELIGV